MTHLAVYVLCAALGLALPEGADEPPEGGEARDDGRARDDAPTPSDDDDDDDDDAPGMPFLQGRWRISAGLGGGSLGGNGYFAISIGGGYFVLDGLEVGLAVEQWLGPPPYITRLSPQVRYVVHQLAPFSPYVGVFYRRWLFWGADDTPDDADTLGGRFGFYWTTSFRAYIGAGAVYERVISACVAGCDVFYPEITIAFSFGGP